MDLLSIPAEVIDAALLPYLDWNDLLRFRRVCKATKAIVHGYMNVHPELAPEIEINEDDKCFRAFLELGIPTTKIFVNNATTRFELYEDAGDDSVEFLEQFGHLIKNLRAYHVPCLINDKERDFLNALLNLESFEAKEFGFGLTRDREGGRRIVEDKLERLDQERTADEKCYESLPSFMKQLKTVNIGNNEDIEFEFIVDFTFGILYLNKVLETVLLPFNTNIPTTAIVYPEFYGKPVAFTFFMISNTLGLRFLPDSPPQNLKVIDFGDYHNYCEPAIRRVLLESGGSFYFLQLCDLCFKNGVQLMNVSPHWFVDWNKPEILQYGYPEIGTPVLSLVNIHSCVFPLNMPNLEKIEIRATSRCTPGVNWRNERPGWPSLKKLHITVVSRRGFCIDLNSRQGREVRQYQDTSALFQFFFQDISRTALTELYLRFTNPAGFVAIPRTEDIISSCSNLKRLTIINWPGTNKALSKLWSGLTGLEEMSLEYCGDLGNVAFVGKDARSPAFLKLRKLKKLALKGLDFMPKITDTLFTLVIRHLKLTHLTLSSRQPIKQVTAAGIRSLLEGTFAKSIEKFSFREWSLANVTEDEFKELEAEFRSSNML